MITKTSPSQDIIKSRMDDLFIFASQVQCNNSHPLRVVQASKSLIGLQLESPPKILFKWLEEYLQDFIPDYDIQSIESNRSPLEVITFNDLKNLIINNKLLESHEYLNYLLQVASPLQIAEYLIELSVKRSLGSLLYCWSAFRSIQFLGEKDGCLFLYHCISKIIEENKCAKDKEELHLEKFEIYCHKFQIFNSGLIRQDKIKPHLKQIVQSIEPELSNIFFSELSEELREMILKQGPSGILGYLSTKELNGITTNLILLLDALRSALKFSGISHNMMLAKLFDSTRGIKHAE